MLRTVLWLALGCAVILALLWLVGMVGSYTLNGFIHLLLLLAVASVLIRIIQGRRPV